MSDILRELDFEAISSSLGIEVNSEIPRPILKKVVSKRLKVLSGKDIDMIPNFVWTALRKHLDEHPPQHVIRESADSIRLVGYSIEDLTNNAKYATWTSHNDVLIEETPAGLELQSEVFKPWTDKNLASVISNILSGSNYFHESA